MSTSGQGVPRVRRLSMGLTAAVCVAFVAGMVGMSFAAVPLYRIFCQVTGFGGTTQTAMAAPTEVGDRTITVRFDANTASELGWTFQPVDRSVQVKLGEVGRVAFRAENLTSHSTTGTASFNVTPNLAGAYFNKLECFCFTEQTLAPGESREMGVVFFVDPAYADDPDLDTIATLTLSYAFYPKAPPRTAGGVAKTDLAAARPAELVGAASGVGGGITTEQ